MVGQFPLKGVVQQLPFVVQAHPCLDEFIFVGQFLDLLDSFCWLLDSFYVRFVGQFQICWTVFVVHFPICWTVEICCTVFVVVQWCFLCCTSVLVGFVVQQISCCTTDLLQSCCTTVSVAQQSCWTVLFMLLLNVDPLAIFVRGAVSCSAALPSHRPVEPGMPGILE